MQDNFSKMNGPSRVLVGVTNFCGILGTIAVSNVTIQLEL